MSNLTTSFFGIEKADKNSDGTLTVYGKATDDALDIDKQICDGDGQQTQSGMVGDESSSNQNTPNQGTTTGDNGNQGTSNSSSNDPSSRGEKNETIQERLERALQEMAQMVMVVQETHQAHHLVKVIMEVML